MLTDYPKVDEPHNCQVDVVDLTLVLSPDAKVLGPHDLCPTSKQAIS